MDEKTIARFWKKVDRRAASACWPFNGARSPTGHGIAWDGRRTHHAHRLAWFLFYGRWPRDCLLHTCDNGWCVNPGHLFEGSRADNMHDMWRKGRGVHPPPRHKLSVAQLQAFCRAATIGVPSSTLAAQYGISRQHANLLKRRLGLRHG